MAERGPDEWEISFAEPVCVLRGQSGEVGIIKTGKSYPAKNMIHGPNGAARFQNRKTGKSVVIDNKTYELLHIGKGDYKY